jgi:hypothetical protein
MGCDITRHSPIGDSAGGISSLPVRPEGLEGKQTGNPLPHASINVPVSAGWPRFRVLALTAHSELCRIILGCPLWAFHATLVRI